MPCFTIFLFPCVTVWLSDSHFYCILWHVIAGFEKKCCCILPLILRLSRLAVGTVQWDDHSLREF